jgi:hypothetical protein
MSNLIRIECMRRPSRKAKRYDITLEPDIAERLRQYGQGNLSLGIRRAGRARSMKLYLAVIEAMRGLIEAHDCAEPLDPHIDNLVELLHIAKPPNRIE